MTLLLSSYGRAASALWVLISLVLVWLFLPEGRAAALNGNPAIQISVAEGAKKVDDIFVAVVKMSDLETSVAQIAVKFNPSVVNVVDVNGNHVPDNISGGLTQGDNGGIIVMAEVINTWGLVKYALMWFSPFAPDGTWADLVSIRFKAVGAGNPDIHFATSSDQYYDSTAPVGYNVSKDGVKTNCTLLQPVVTISTQEPGDTTTNPVQSAAGAITAPPKTNVGVPEETEKPDKSNKSDTTHDPYTLRSSITDQITVIPGEFKDTLNHWARRNIERLVGSGTVKGYNDGSFKPENRITRAEFATILANALGLGLESSYQLSFQDNSGIPLWAKSSVAAVVKNRIVGGYPDGTFKAGNVITRAEIAVMIAKAVQLRSQQGATLSFVDNSSIPGWAKDSVMAAVENGIISGYADKTFGANNRATRAEAVTMIVRMLDYLNSVK